MYLEYPDYPHGFRSSPRLPTKTDLFITASFNRKKNYLHNLEHGILVYITHLDTQKTFCIVWRHTQITMNQTDSVWFLVSQEIKQGGVLSTFLHPELINDILQKLQNKEHIPESTV